MSMHRAPRTSRLPSPPPSRTLGPLWAYALALALAWAGGGCGVSETTGHTGGGGGGTSDAGEVASGADGAGADIMATPGGVDTTGPGDGAGDADGCPANTHRGPAGDCVDDVCVPGVSTCATPTTVRLCDDQGASWSETECPDEEICELGGCVAPVCTPGTEGGCEDGRVLVCNSIGTGWTKGLCPNGQACQEGACHPVRPDVLLLVDTSASMNWRPDGSSVDGCLGASCPSWTYPACDDVAAPQTRLGRVKDALTRLLASDGAASVSFALQRFPRWHRTARADGGPAARS